MKIMLAKSYLILFSQILTLMFLLWIIVQPVEVRLTETDVILCNAFLVIGFLGCLFMLFSKKIGRMTVFDACVVLWVLYYICRAWVGAEYPCATEFLQVMEMIVLYVVLRLMFHLNKVKDWMICVTIMLFACYESILGIIQILSGVGRHEIFVLTGTFQNPGPYSACLMMAGIITMYYFSSKRLYTTFSFLRIFPEEISLYVLKNERFARVTREVFCCLLFLVSILPLVLLPATWSRAAMIGFCVCLFWILRDKYLRYRWVILVVFVIASFALYFLKRGSADGRTLIWMASLTSWSHRIWFGVGIGGFRNACAEGIAEMWRCCQNHVLFNSAGVTDYAYNIFVKVLVEQGLIGAVLWITIVFVGMSDIRRRSKALFVSMMSLLVFSMFSYPFDMLPYRIIAVMTFAWCGSAEKSKIYLHLNKIVCTFISTIAIALGLFLRMEIAERIRRDNDVVSFAGYSPIFLANCYASLPYEADNAPFLFDVAKTLRTEKRYVDSNAILRMGTQVSADPMFYVIMGNNYRDRHLYDLAKCAYEKAYAVMPNRLYPLYLLMMMYADIGDEELSEYFARRVKQAYVKIESDVTRRMRVRADGILRHSASHRSDMETLDNE